MLEKGWSRSPWTRVVVEEAPAAVVIEDEALRQAEADAEAAELHVPDAPPPGRGRRRRDAVVALDDEVDVPEPAAFDEVDTTATEDDDASWRK